MNEETNPTMILISLDEYKELVKDSGVLQAISNIGSTAGTSYEEVGKAVSMIFTGGPEE